MSEEFSPRHVRDFRRVVVAHCRQCRSPTCSREREPATLQGHQTEKVEQDLAPRTFDRTHMNKKERRKAKKSPTSPSVAILTNRGEGQERRNVGLDQVLERVLRCRDRGEAPRASEELLLGVAPVCLAGRDRHPKPATAFDGRGPSP